MAARHPSPPRIALSLTAVIVAVTDEAPRLLTVTGEAREAETLPVGALDAAANRTLDLSLRALVRSQTGMELGYVEQLYTFGDLSRSADHVRENVREISVAYLALVREERVPAGADAHWRDWYAFLPWEDWRGGRPRAIDATIAPALRSWADEAPEPDARRARRERVDITFGLAGAPFDRLRVLERYELLYEARLVAEASRDAVTPRHTASKPGRGAGDAFDAHLGRPMALDHRRIIASALSRVRGKLQYRPVVFELLPPDFTLLQLQRLVEALAGVRLHKQNFRRLVERGGLVEGTGRLDEHTGGRPAELFRFRRDVLRERRAPGVGLPATRES